MKQIIVMRNDLNMRKGKMVAQGAHASMGAILPYLHPSRSVSSEEMLQQMPKILEWLAGPFKKICVRVDSEDELIEVEMKAAATGLITCLITDSGLTEFGGTLTITCAAIGPDTDEALAPITGHLTLL